MFDFGMRNRRTIENFKGKCTYLWFEVDVVYPNMSIK